MKRWTHWCGTAALFGLMGLTGCSKPAAEAPKPATMAVTAITIAQASMARTVQLSGSVAPWEEIRLGVELSGHRVQSVLVEPGAIVQKGDVLLRLDGRMLAVELRQATAQLEQARTNLELARTNAQRGRDMLRQKVISAQQAEEWMAGEKTSAAAVTVAEATVAAARLRSEFAQLQAPYAGVIATRTVEPGQIVNPGDVLMTLVRDARLEWRAEVTEANLLAIEPGQIVRLRSLDGQTIEGTVRTRSPGLDARTRTGLVYVDLPDPKSLRSGMFVEGTIGLGDTEALRVPSDALLLRDGFAYVFVLDEQSKARERRVEVGPRQNGWVEVRSGLSAGERIVGKGAAFLGDGDPVRVVDGTGT
ncbi:MAG: efflux RND transporter periplasmic adaptor subunit [Ahniella sp.]|nr:efflux RND transporter periplasmic adaptor subunit [Ahniella sp.]